MLIESALGKLCNNLRIYAEKTVEFDRLKLIDSEEAITNLDRAFEAILESFHSLYDVSKKEVLFFEDAACAFLIMLRNAIHHRNHNLFNSWNHEMILNGGLRKSLGATFLLCDYVPKDSTSRISRYYFRLSDIYERLDDTYQSKFLDTHLNQTKRTKQLGMFKKDLSLMVIEDQAKLERYPLKQVYVNVLPILNSALKFTFDCLSLSDIKPVGYDAKCYFESIRNDCIFDLQKVNYTPLKVSEWLV